MKTKFKLALIIFTMPFWFFPVLIWFYITDLYEHLRK